tara:strand:+ start:1296 stop:1481 length:186 start_codon:yes stop_codon:yes gene_type:complete
VTILILRKKLDIMKIKELNIEKINKEELVFVNGGTEKDSKKKDIESTTGDCSTPGNEPWNK